MREVGRASESPARGSYGRRAGEQDCSRRLGETGLPPRSVFGHMRRALVGLLLALVAASGAAPASGTVIGWGPLGLIPVEGRFPAPGSMVTPGPSVSPHEPNHPDDRFPGAIRIPCPMLTDDLRGACNDYRGQRHGPRLFFDLKAHRVAPLAGDHVAYPANVVRPGAYSFEAPVGRWHDFSHEVSELVYLQWTIERPECIPARHLWGLEGLAHWCRYMLPPDGWVGNVVATSHQYRWEGHDPEMCKMHGSHALWEHAVCNPFRDGWSADANAYSIEESLGEYSGGCSAIDSLGRKTPVRVAPPPNQTWGTVFVWRNAPDGHPHSVEDWSGTASPLFLGARCEGGSVRTTDLLVLPTGIRHPVTTSITLTDALTRERASDVDLYVPFGGYP
jgi:hypothetical protein